MKALKKYIHLIKSIPKTIYFNFKYLKIRDAIKLPILVSSRVFMQNMNGKVIIDSHIKPGMIKIGFGKTGLFDYKKDRCIWSNEGTIVFKGKAYIGPGSKICTDRPSGEIIFGENFTITANSKIWSRKRIEFGNNNLVSWENMFMDTDSHNIYDDYGKYLNADKSIKIGNDVWIGCRCTVLKGTKIGNNTVVASNSVLVGDYAKHNNSIIGGNPIRLLKDNIYWEI